MKYNYDNSISLKDLHFALNSYTIEKASKVLEIPIGTLKSYRADPKASNYRDWKGISIKKAVEILANYRLHELQGTGYAGYDIYPDIFSSSIDDDFLFEEISFQIDIPERNLADFRDKIVKTSLQDRQKLAHLWQIAHGRLQHIEYSEDEQKQAAIEVNEFLIHLAEKYYYVPSTIAYIDSMVINSAIMWINLDNETREKYASFQEFYKQHLENEEKYFWNEQTSLYQDKQLKKYINIMQADLINQWSADGYLDELEEYEIDMNGNFIDNDGDYTEIMGFHKLDDLNRFLREDYIDFISQNQDYQDLDEEGQEFWRYHVR